LDPIFHEFHDAVTDSDRHYPLPRSFDITEAFTAILIKTNPFVKMVTEDELLKEELEDAKAKEEALQDMELNNLTEKLDDKHKPAPPYPDPFIKPPIKPPPTGLKKVSFKTKP
jgi:hypothetical protein